MNSKLAKTLRRNMTPAELRLWQLLRDRRFIKLKFRRQYPIGPYIVDFVCVSRKLIIELDGSQHLEQIEYDAKRTAYLQRFGFRVLRFWNNELFMEEEAVLAQIYVMVEK